MSYAFIGQMLATNLLGFSTVNIVMIMIMISTIIIYCFVI